MASSLRGGPLIAGNRVALPPGTSAHSIPSPIFTVHRIWGGGSFLNGQGCFPPCAQFPDCLCKSHPCQRRNPRSQDSVCQRRNPRSPDPRHTTGRDVSGRLQQSEQVSFIILQGPWASTAPTSIHPSIRSLGPLPSSRPRPFTRSRHAPSQPPAELVRACKVPKKMGSLGSGA